MIRRQLRLLAIYVDIPMLCILLVGCTAVLTLLSARFFAIMVLGFWVPLVTGLLNQAAAHAASGAFVRTRPGWRQFDKTLWVFSFVAAGAACILVALQQYFGLDRELLRLLSGLRGTRNEPFLLDAWHWSLVPFAIVATAAWRLVLAKKGRRAALLALLAIGIPSFPIHAKDPIEVRIWELWSSPGWIAAGAIAAIALTAGWWQKPARIAGVASFRLTAPFAWLAGLPWIDLRPVVLCLLFIGMLFLCPPLLGVGRPFSWRQALFGTAVFAAFLGLVWTMSMRAGHFWLSRPSRSGGGFVAGYRRLQSSGHGRCLIVAALLGIPCCVNVIPGLGSEISVGGVLFLIGTASLTWLLLTVNGWVLPREGSVEDMLLGLGCLYIGVNTPAMWADVLGVSSPLLLPLVIVPPLAISALTWRLVRGTAPGTVGNGTRAAWFLVLVAYAAVPLAWREHALVGNALEVFLYSVLHAGRGLVALLVLVAVGVWSTRREARNGRRSPRMTRAALALSCVVPFAGTLLLHFTRSRASWLAAPKYSPNGLVIKIAFPLLVAAVAITLPVGTWWDEIAAAKFIEDQRTGAAFSPYEMPARVAWIAVQPPPARLSFQGREVPNPWVMSAAEAVARFGGMPGQVQLRAVLREQLVCEPAAPRFAPAYTVECSLPVRPGWRPAFEFAIEPPATHVVSDPGARIEEIVRGNAGPRQAADLLSSALGGSALWAVTQHAHAFVFMRAETSDPGHGEDPRSAVAGRYADILRVLARNAGLDLPPVTSFGDYALLFPDDSTVLPEMYARLSRTCAVLEIERAPERLLHAVVCRLAADYVAGRQGSTSLHWVWELLDGDACADAMDRVSAGLRARLFALRWLMCDELRFLTGENRRLLAPATIPQRRYLLERESRLMWIIYRMTAVGPLERQRTRLFTTLRLSVFDDRAIAEIAAFPDVEIVKWLDMCRAELTDPQHAEFLRTLTAKLRERWPNDEEVARWYTEAHGEGE